MSGKDILFLPSPPPQPLPSHGYLWKGQETLYLPWLQIKMASSLFSLIECFCFMNSFFIIIKVRSRLGQIPCVINQSGCKCPLRHCPVLSFYSSRNLSPKKLRLLHNEALSGWHSQNQKPEFLTASSLNFPLRCYLLSYLSDLPEYQSDNNATMAYFFI